MAEKIADIFAEVDARTGKYDQEMAGVHKKANGMGAVFGKLGGAIAGAFAVREVLRFSTALITASADAEEAANKFDVVFGESAQGVRAWSREIENSFGGSQTEVENWLSGFQDILVPLGMARDEAATLSKRLVTLSGDLGSFQNKKTADVITNITSAMMGMHRAGYSLGIIMKQDAVEAEAMAMTGKKAASELTEIEKMMARVEIMTRQSADANGDWVRTMDSLANRTKIMQKAWGDLKIVLGDSLKQLFDAKGFVTALGNAMLSLNTKIKALNDEGFFIKLSENLKAFGKIALAIFKPIISLVDFLSKALMDLLKLLGKGLEVSGIGQTMLLGLDTLLGGEITDIMNEREENIKRRMAELKQDQQAPSAALGGDGGAGEEKMAPETKRLEFGGLGDILKRAQATVLEKGLELDKERNKILEKIAKKDPVEEQQPILA